MAPSRWRRLLLLESSLKLGENYEFCYMCYVCPDYCTKYRPRPPPPSPPHQRPQMQTVLIITLCVLGASFLFLFYLIASRRTRNSRRGGDFLPPADNPNWFVKTTGYPQSTIDSIGVVQFKKKEGTAGVQETDCSICMSEFEEHESLRLLPECSHAFHVPCIDTWLSSHINCPVCRTVPIGFAAMNDAAAGGNAITDSLDSRNFLGSREERGSSENITDHDAIDELSADPIEEDAEKSSESLGGEKLRVRT